MRTLLSIALALGIAGLIPPAAAQALLADLDPRPADRTPGSEPRSFAGLGNGIVLFSAKDAEHGRELWRSDGSPNGTELLLEFAPGPLDGIPAGSLMLPLAGRVLGFASDAQGGFLWSSDGSRAGTSIVARIAWPIGLAQGSWAADAQRLFWVGYDQVHGAELWSSDGTSAGTGLVLDFAPGNASAFPSVAANFSMRVIAGSLWYAASDGNTGYELCRSDGTAAGTRRVAELAPGPADGNPRLFVPFRNGVAFLGPSSLEPGARSLWFSDGSASGTREVAGWSVGSFFEGEMLELNGRLLYSGFSHGYGMELFVSDGTAAGTHMILDLNPGIAASSPSQFIAHAGIAYFTAYDAHAGRELWRSDGTAPGTWRVADLLPGTSSGSPHELLVAGGALWFAAGGNVGIELWTSDGSATGTRVVADLRSGAASSSPSQLRRIGQELWFAADDGVHGSEPHRSDGSAAGTRLVADLAQNRFGSDPGPALITGMRAVFHATTPTTGREPHGTDGATVALWRDVAAGSAWSTDALFELRGDEALWALGSRIFTTDLQLGQERTVVTATATGMARLGGRVAYGAGLALWVSDGTPTGTTLVRSFAGSAFYPRGPHAMRSFGDRVLFLASEGALSPNSGLWISDGTPAGTRLLVTAAVHLAGSARVECVIDGSRVFALVTSNGSRQLHVSDGVTTTLLANHASTRNPERGIAALPGGVLFAGSDATHGEEPWFSDGSPTGTSLLVDLAPGGPGSAPDWFTAVGGLVYVAADDGTHGAELFVTDGSAGGTRLVRDVAAGRAASSPAELLAVGDGGIVCRMFEPSSGAEAWFSDGSSAGTRLIRDLAPGARSSRPGSFARLGTRLLWSADDGEHGREPFVMPIAALGVPLVETLGAPCAGSAGRLPLIAALGSPRLGANAFGIRLSAARPGAPAALLVASSAGQLTLPASCTLRAAQPLLALSAICDGAGLAALPIAIAADPALVGIELVAQWLVADPSGALLGALAASAGLRVQVGR